MEYYPIIIKSQIPEILVIPEEGIFKVASNTLEKVLADKLLEIFGTKIAQNKKVGYYFPDIIFFDRLNGIFIDIEVDEPYAKSGTPTHYIDDKNDLQRDRYFTENGWNVMRFSENQVKHQIEKVIKTIILFCETLTEKTTDNLETHLKSFSEKRWSYSNSLEWIKAYRRDYYSYQTQKVDENTITEIRKFLTLADIFNEIIKNNLPNFNYATETIFLPYFISDHYLNVTNSTKLLFLYCMPSQGLIEVHGKEFAINHFSNCPKLEIISPSDLESFNYITDKKRNNCRIHVVNDSHEKYYYYDFFYQGTMQDFYDSTLQLHLKI